MQRDEDPRYFPQHQPLPAEIHEQLERLAFRWGESYDAYLVTETGHDYFFSHDRSGAVGFQRWGRHLQIVGGLLAPPERRSQLLGEFIEFAERRRWSLAFFNVNRVSGKLFREHGFELSKIGEEPIVRLDETDWHGKSYEWLRRQENYCARQGMVVREIVGDLESAEYRAMIPELEAISREHIGGTVHGRELECFVGRFEPRALGRRRLFVAESSERIEAFVVLNPCLAGSMWATEIYRKRRDAVRGAVPFAMLRIFRQLQAEGVPYASLSGVPWLRCHLRVAVDSWKVRGGGLHSWEWAGPAFDVHGMYPYKSRFRPHWRELYLAARPAVSWGAMVALLMRWKVFHVNPLRVALHWLRRKRDRQPLAEPPWRAEQLIRELRLPQFREGIEAATNVPTPTIIASALVASLQEAETP